MNTKSKRGIYAITKIKFPFIMDSLFICILIHLYYREAVSGLCERRGFDIDSIEVYLDNNKTPLPLLTSETSWLSGRTVRIKGQFKCIYIQIYLFVFFLCPIITHELLHRFTSNFDWGTRESYGNVSSPGFYVEWDPLFEEKES